MISNNVRGERPPPGQPTQSVLSPQPRRAIWTPDTAPQGSKCFGGFRHATSVCLALIILGTVVMVAHCLWMSHTTEAGAVFQAGSLKVHLGELTWREVSADVPEDQRRSGTGQDIASYIAKPGDSLELRQPVQATLEGDNLVAGLTTSWDPDFELPPGASATYVVEDENGDQVLPAMGNAPVGTELSVSGVLPAGRDFTIVVTWYLDSTEHLADSVDAAPMHGTVLPQLLIDLHQSRG